MPLRPIIRALVVPVLGLSLPDNPPVPVNVVNINISIGALALLPGVGTVLMARIVAHRSEHGPFRFVEDLMRVKGVSERLFTTLRPYLVVRGPTTLVRKVAVRP